MTAISYHLQQIKERILLACQQASRSADSVQLLAVSKTFGTDAIQEAFEAGQKAFGENYVAEGVSKIQHFSQQGNWLEWHMIGHMQANKTREVAENFQWAHAVDRFRIARRLNEQRPEALPPLQVCIEVNISHEASKSGVMPEEVRALAEEMAGLPHLKLRGLMCIPEPAQGLEAQRKPFALLRTLFEDLQKSGHEVDTLSMGMSDDLEAAILEGATLVRIGRAVFGER